MNRKITQNEIQMSIQINTSEVEKIEKEKVEPQKGSKDRILEQ